MRSAFDFLGIDHVQLAAPARCEAEARAFYGGVLGWEEIPKPAALQARGGERIFAADPFGNRLEFLERKGGDG